MRTKYEEGQEFTLNQDFDTCLDGNLFTVDNIDGSICRKGSKIVIQEIEEEGCEGCSRECSNCDNSIKVDFKSIGNWILMSEEDIDKIIEEGELNEIKYYNNQTQNY